MDQVKFEKYYHWVRIGGARDNGPIGVGLVCLAEAVVYAVDKLKPIPINPAEQEERDAVIVRVRNGLLKTAKGEYSPAWVSNAVGYLLGALGMKFVREFEALLEGCKKSDYKQSGLAAKSYLTTLSDRLDNDILDCRNTME